MSLEKDVGEMKGMLDQLIPQIKRALNNQEEAFKRLKDNEVLAGKNETAIGCLGKSVDGLNKASAKISGIVSVAITVAINAFFKFILWKDQ